MDSEKNKEFLVNEKELMGGKAVEKFNSGKNRAVKGLLNHMTQIIACAILAVAAAVLFTDIKLSDFNAMAELSLTVGVLWFCSYSMFLNMADSGVNAGKNTAGYIEQITAYEEKTEAIKRNGRLGRLAEFCENFTVEELKQARINRLCDVDYDEYIMTYAGKGKKALLSTGLGKNRTKCVLAADKLRPIKLNPDKILKRGRGDVRRSPLGIAPDRKLAAKKGTKALTSILISIFTGSILLEVTVNLTWATFAACLLKLLPIALSAVKGYKSGYDNITVTTANYIKDQISLIDQFNNYCDTHKEGA